MRADVESIKSNGPLALGKKKKGATEEPSLSYDNKTTWCTFPQLFTAI